MNLTEVGVFGSHGLCWEGKGQFSGRALIRATSIHKSARFRLPFAGCCGGGSSGSSERYQILHIKCQPDTEIFDLSPTSASGFADFSI
uniref:Uncharacterized protein n=1 Tax=Romanomermis culicivorax TaxID=13658 RepID=A0A915L7A3_ROMCU